MVQVGRFGAMRIWGPKVDADGAGWTTMTTTLLDGCLMGPRAPPLFPLGERSSRIALWSVSLHRGMFANDRKAVEALFSQIDQLAVSSDGIDDALDLVYLEFDRWMERGLTHRLELVFALADPERWDLSIAIGLLSASLPMADTIKARAWFLEGAIGVSCDAGLDVHRLFGGL